MDEGMLKRILGIDPDMRVISTTIGFYDGGSQKIREEMQVGLEFDEIGL